MGRTRVLILTLAVAAMLLTVADATWSSTPGTGAWTADLRAGVTKEEFVAGPVVILRPPVLRGRAEYIPAPMGDEGPDCDGTGLCQQLDGEENAVLTVLRSRRVRALTWIEADLVQVVAYLRTASGLDIHLTPAVGNVAFDDVEISLWLNDVALEAVLDLVTEPHELCWSVEDGRVRIATEDEASGALATRYFDIKDLLPCDESFLADSRFPPAEPPDPQGIDPERAMLDLIRETIGGAWAWERPAFLEVCNRIVIAHNDPHTLGRVGAFVEALIAEVEAAGGLDSYLETHRWSTVTGAPPRSLVR